MELSEAAALVPVRPGGDILLMLRDDRPDLPNPNRWTTIGGAVEPGESPREAALREAEEEVGRRPDQLVPFGTVDGARFRSFLFAAPVTWTLHDLILGEGQALDWFPPEAFPSAPIVRHIGAAIARFVETDTYRSFAAGEPPATDPPLAPFPFALAGTLGLRRGCLVAVRGASAAFVYRLRRVLNGARVTASPADHERPDLFLWWPRGEQPEPVLFTWRNRIADGGAILVVGGADALGLPAATLREIGYEAGLRDDGMIELPDGERALRLMKTGNTGAP